MVYYTGTQFRKVECNTTHMESKKNIIIAVVVVVVVIVIGYFVWKAPGGAPGATNVPQGATTTSQGAVVAPGASAISTSTGVVVTKTGTAAKNNVTPGSPEAPQQSAPIAPSQVPSAIKLTVTASGFTPSTITVSAGKAVTLAITSGDTQTHVFMFDDPSLSAVAVGIGPGETRAITFNAPSSAGTYGFHCDVPGHKARGEVGKMVVQ